MAKSPKDGDEKFSDREAQRRFEQALKGASKASRKEGKPPAARREKTKPPKPQKSKR